jgi:hypothetical protein
VIRRAAFALPLLACASRGHVAHVTPDAPDAPRARYTVTYDGEAMLDVEATIVATSDRFTVERGAEKFVRDLTYTSGATWRDAAATEGTFVLPGCEHARCRVRYRYALRAAAKAIDRITTASEEGAVIVAPPSTWLLAPAQARGRLELTVTTRAGLFVSGSAKLPRRGKLADRGRGEAEVGAGNVDGVYTIDLEDLWTSPYAAFGPLTARTIEVATEKLTLARAPGRLALDDGELATYAKGAADAVAGYFGRFPMNDALILIVPSRGRWMGEARALAGGGGGIFMRIGEDAPARAYAADWVLVHEMIHFGFPAVEHDWAQEGLATYVEPIARARAGLIPAARAWRDLCAGLPNGLPRGGDRGLDFTSTWGRTYWGGALFYLLADIAIRKESNGRLGLEHALRGILARGGHNGKRWPLEAAFRAADDAIGGHVLTELHAAMGASPHPVDLDRLFEQLGIERHGRDARLVAAPLSSIREAIIRSTEVPPRDR